MKGQLPPEAAAHLAGMDEGAIGDWEERAAIFQYDGRMIRHKAEWQAYVWLCARLGIDVRGAQSTMVRATATPRTVITK